MYCLKRARRVLRIICWRNFPHCPFGAAEAHSQAELMEFNYLSERGAIQRERRDDIRSITRACRKPWQTWRKNFWNEATGIGACRSWLRVVRSWTPERNRSLKSAANTPMILIRFLVPEGSDRGNISLAISSTNPAGQHGG